jgi:pantoate--beta-alanine ligase
MSSRNAYLSPEDRSRAGCLYPALREAAEAVNRGERDARRLVRAAMERIAAAGPAGIDYVEVVDAETLAAVGTLTGPARMCVAVRFGAARLIDNVALDGGGAGQ